MEQITLSGRVVTGIGEAASFTQVTWAQEQFIAKLGIDPYPGTLNLILDIPEELAKWANLKTNSGRVVTTPDSAWCDARCYPVQIAGQIPGAILFPEVRSYPEAQIEIIAALPLREQLSLVDGDKLSLTICQPLSVRAALFDVDGTLVDSVQAYRVVAERAVASYSIPITIEMVRHALNVNHPNFWEMAVPANQPNRAEVMKEIRKEAMRQWPEVLRRYGGLFSGVRETLETLQNRGLRLGIVTGSRGDSMQPLREAGLMEFFETVITGQDVERRKPDPEGLLKGIAALGVTPDNTVYIGDGAIDIQASHAAGVASVGVLSGAGDSALLSAEGPDWLVHSHADLPGILKT